MTLLRRMPSGLIPPFPMLEDDLAMMPIDGGAIKHLDLCWLLLRQTLSQVNLLFKSLSHVLSTNRCQLVMHDSVMKSCGMHVPLTRIYVMQSCNATCLSLAMNVRSIHAPSGEYTYSIQEASTARVADMWILPQNGQYPCILIIMRLCVDGTELMWQLC
jgi:hypothetical protein